MSYTVKYSPEALQRLDAIEDFIAQASSPFVAARYVDAIVTYCESLAIFPHRGIRRDDLMPGLRVTNHAGSAVITFEVDTHARTVSIFGIYDGGQNYEAGEGRND